jgi:hypothetical protein
LTARTSSPLFKTPFLGIKNHYRTEMRIYFHFDTFNAKRVRKLKRMRKTMKVEENFYLFMRIKEKSVRE